MIFFEVFRQLDVRMYRTVKVMNPLLNPCTKYIIDGNNLIILGTNVSCKWDIYNRQVSEDNPYKHWDMEGETLYWFSEESAEGAVIRMISNAFRQWFDIDPFDSFIEFERSESVINQRLQEYGLSIVWDMDNMAVSKNGEMISFEQAIMLIMEDDALKEAGISIDEWLYDARYFRQTDQLERAIEQYERVLRYSNNTMRVYTESAFCLAESYYFLDDYEKAVDMYFKCNLEYIEDETDFYIHIGHALLDVKMVNFKKSLRIYYRGCLDQAYAMGHMREIERAAAEVGDNFELYESECFRVGQSKYAQHIMSLPMKSDALNEILVVEADEKDKKERMEIAKNRYYDVRLIKPTYLSDVDSISLNDAMSTALLLFMNGEYQKAYEMYYKLSESLDHDSDHYTWVNFQLGKLYCICNDPLSAFTALQECQVGKFGVVYRQSDFFILYTHVKIMCDDFESDERFRKLIRGKYDYYYAKYDPEYVKLTRNSKMMNAFRRYETECKNAAKEEFAIYLNTDHDEKSSRKRGVDNKVLKGISKYFNE